MSNDANADTISDFVKYLRSVVLTLLSVSVVLIAILVGASEPNTVRVQAYIEFLRAISFDHPSNGEVQEWLGSIREAAIKESDQVRHMEIPAYCMLPDNRRVEFQLVTDHYYWRSAWTSETRDFWISGGSRVGFGPLVPDRALPAVAMFEELWNELIEPVFVDIPVIDFPLAGMVEGQLPITVQRGTNAPKDRLSVFQTRDGYRDYVFANRNPDAKGLQDLIEIPVKYNSQSVSAQHYLIEHYWPKTTSRPPVVGVFRESFPELFPYLPNNRHMRFSDFTAQVLRQTVVDAERIEILGGIKIPASLIDSFGLALLLVLHLYLVLHLRRFTSLRFSKEQGPLPWLAMYPDWPSVVFFRLSMLLPLGPAAILLWRGNQSDWFVVGQAGVSALLTGWVYQMHHRMVVAQRLRDDTIQNSPIADAKK